MKIPIQTENFFGILISTRIKSWSGCKKNLKIPKGHSDNQNPYIEEEWPKEKVQKDKQRFTKHT
jgi:hypothetical protein